MKLRSVFQATKEWPDPTPDMLNDPLFEAIWKVIKTWDINVPDAYFGYCGASGNHVRAILDGIVAAQTQNNRGRFLKYCGVMKR